MNTHTPHLTADDYTALDALTAALLAMNAAGTGERTSLWAQDYNGSAYAGVTKALKRALTELGGRRWARAWYAVWLDTMDSAWYVSQYLANMAPEDWPA
jgi:hypothetical protein